MNRLRLILLLLIAAAIAAYLSAGGEQLLDPARYQAYYRDAPGITAAIFLLSLLAGTALSLPITGVGSVIAGIVFGHWLGIALIVLGCAAGGTLAFLASRFILHDLIQQRFADQLAVVNAGIKREGAFYVFGLRMVPVMPFWLLNLLIGITPMAVGRFFLATATGMLPITIVLVHFGTQIGAVDSFSLRAIFSPGLLLSLCLLGLLPFVTKGLVKLARHYLR